MSNELYTILERLGNLLRSESREQGLELGLQPVQHDALFYLSICNRYSDTPLAVTEFLGLTKGTVSQTLKVLESRRLIDKERDVGDKRMVHLKLSDTGKKYIENTMPPANFLATTNLLSKSDLNELQSGLSKVLQGYQSVSGRKGFGVCNKCQYNISQNGEFICGLTQDFLSKRDVKLICREFT